MRAKGFFDFQERRKRDSSVINVVYDPRKKKWLVTREGRRKAYVAFDTMPTINLMGKRMREGDE
uniref:Uncharacterized protein n=1 Tax=viral metagenome TaxID=1070528 RepID=A0A6M3JXL2_9ZZZZ